MRMHELARPCGNSPTLTRVTTVSGPQPYPSTAPSQDIGNPALVSALSCVGLSPRDLVRAINDRVVAVGHRRLDVTAGYNWCRGAVPRSPLVRHVAAAVLSDVSNTGYTVENLWGQAQAGAADPLQSQWATDDLVGPRDLPDVLNSAASWTSGSTNVATMRAATPDQLSAAVWDAMRQQDRRVLGSGGDHAERVDPPLMTVHEEHLKSLRRLDDKTGGGPLSQRQVRIALFDVITLLRTSSYTPDIRIRLLRTAAGLAQLGGWMAFDGSLAAAAQRYQLLALRLAQAAGDHDTVANVLGMLAYQHSAHARPAEALRFATSAVEYSSHGLPLVRARALGRLATAHASAGDIDSFRRAADQCRHLIAQRTPDDPAALYYFTDDQLAAESGHALVELASSNPRFTRKLLAEAADLLSPMVSEGTDGEYKRSAVLHGIHLARARLLAKDTDATAHILTSLAGQLPGVQSMRCRDLLINVRRSAGRPLRSAHRTDAIEAVDQALSAA